MTWGLRCAAWLVVVAACRYNSDVFVGEDAVRAPLDTAGPLEDGIASVADATGCTPDVACSTNPGAPCVVGRTSCVGGPSCVDDVAAPDGTSCGAGLCTLGGCLAPTTISAPSSTESRVDLGTTPVTAGRRCAEAPHYAVTGFADRASALVTPPPEDDCLVAGDEVMLINLQGAAGAEINVGNWELLRIADVTGAMVRFTAGRTRSYGSSVDADDNIGMGAESQKVAIVRVPRFGAALVAAGAVVTPLAWDGNRGGVLAIRAARLTIDGVLDVSRAGYRSGRWSQDDSQCTKNVATECGESISGPPSATTARSAGGPGGIAAAQGPSFLDNPPVSPTAGHATPGRDGFNANGRVLGEAGGVYGAPDASKLTLGSGSSGNLTCVTAPPRDAQLVDRGPPGAGIVAVFAEDLAISTTGRVVAAPVAVERDVAASGGYVYLRAANIDLGTDRVDARGAVANAGTPRATAAGQGYIVVQSSVAVGGTTLPPYTRP